MLVSKKEGSGFCGPVNSLIEEGGVGFLVLSFQFFVENAGSSLFALPILRFLEQRRGRVFVLSFQFFLGREGSSYVSNKASR